MRVEQLIRHLETGDPNSTVAVFGHFGEAIELNLEDFRFVQNYIAESYLVVSSVDIGPEPE